MEMVEIVDKNVYKIMTLSNDLYVFADFKTIISRPMCSVHSIWFMKYVFC